MIRLEKCGLDRPFDMTKNGLRRSCDGSRSKIDPTRTGSWSMRWLSRDLITREVILCSIFGKRMWCQLWSEFENGFVRAEDGDGACANYVTVPGFHGFEDAQTDWVARQMRPAEKLYCWERRKGVVFRLWTELGPVFFFLFSRWWSRTCCVWV